ncbi:MAG TPA: sn-glycerol-3-phosphate ABC transporter ATP-binding protein UgpC [Myxococcota bacterium]|nr:sn-glycerol-3-phosphate ABC transporter ATP-binding protein UgpC [Myxococcota bacterium]HRY93524.1 sn-glycerol-3-phosphate ABC transporter ATP-binding protein UgpC [Myxococcota bacterium]HSA20545.1 sn-glycerol-3-phosphate ABC transporter ATP-binding protein UgpC [Myxococcota bacterium]
MADVVLKGVRKQYGEAVVVPGVDLTIRSGEFVVLVGPSGCGKSTTLRMIAGLEEITAGELSIDGRRVNEVHPKDRDIAMVFQSYALYPHMTARENMSFGLKIRGMTKAEIEARVGEAADILGLAELLDRKPKDMSGGQRQRVAMGRAIVRKPKVFLFDEPLSNLDAKLRVQMRAEIAKLHQRIQTTIVYVTHDQVEAMTLADRIVIMDKGVVQQVGTPLEVFEHPRNRFVAGFIGSPAMNFIACELGPGGLLTGDGLRLELPGNRQALEGRSGPVELGMRPNTLAVSRAGAEPRADRLRAKIEVMEPMGSETYLYATCQGQLLTVRVEATAALAEGDTIELAPDLERAHLFDRATGEAFF